MTVTPPEPLVTGGLRSLEVRWILPGQLEPAVAGWFARFPAEMAARQDAYLLDPELGGLSVKVRAGAALEVKVYRGSRESSIYQAAPAAASSPGGSGHSRSARPARTAASRPGGR